MLEILKKIAAFVFGLIEVLLIFRFVLKLFGASAQSGFVAWVYSTTYPLIEPFLFAFPTPNINGRFILEFTTLFAIFAYAFIGYLVQELLSVLGKRHKK